MTEIVVDGRAIMIGYEWKLRVNIEATSALFPSGCTLAAHVRTTRGAADVLASLTTGSGLTRISDSEIEIALTAEHTGAMTAGSVVCDVVRTDTTPDQHLSFALTIPVLLPVTRGLA